MKSFATLLLLLAGGVLLLWVCWKMWRALQGQKTHDQAEAEAELEKYRNHLEELVADRTNALAEAKNAAETIKQRLVDFLVGHADAGFLRARDLQTGQHQPLQHLAGQDLARR